jgi:hypothetical protein
VAQVDERISVDDGTLNAPARSQDRVVSDAVGDALSRYLAASWMIALPAAVAEGQGR